MVMVNCAYKKEFKKGVEPEKQLYRAIEGHPLLKRYERVLKAALQGKYQSAAAMKSAMLKEGQLIASRKASQKKQQQKKWTKASWSTKPTGDFTIESCSSKKNTSTQKIRWAF